MVDIRKKTIFSFLALGFLVASIFSCILATQDYSMVHHGDSVERNCCDDSFLGTMIHDLPIILQNTNVLQLMVLLFLSFYLFSKNSYIHQNLILAAYFKIRDRYGGFNIFQYFISLFSRGILHPKIY
ncbi:hypothetical protein C0580_05040 [Candidatus Parcubacteria bacterium]|nr:MAG: hypothetical protein C0580_05040 [Candidatus Parcubacteria bacterium]